MTTPHIIIGNAMAGMVAALGLAERGQAVTLINPGGPLGGYFAGIQLGGQRFDNGLVMFECDGYMQQTAALASYNPAVRNDVGRFLHVVHAWASQFGPLHEIAMPQMRYQGAWFDDVLSSNGYAAFAQLPFANAALQALQTPHLPAYHAREKAAGAAYQDLDLATASRANHGQVLHDALIAPYLAKTLGVPAEQILARYHRIGWLPLYYPETLQACFAGHAVPLSPTRFHYPSVGSVAEVCAQLQTQVSAHPNIRYLAAPVQGLKQTASGWQVSVADSTLQTSALAYTGAPAQLLKLLGQAVTPATEIKAPIAVMFLRIHRSDLIKQFSVLHLPEANGCIYRVTNQTLCAGQADAPVMHLTLEFNTDFYASLYGEADNDQAMMATLCLELAALAITSSDAYLLLAELKRIPGGFLVPTQAARDAWLADHAALQAHAPDIHLMAMASGFFVTSLNDQIIQGLHYAHMQVHHPATERLACTV